MIPLGVVLVVVQLVCCTVAGAGAISSPNLAAGFIGAVGSQARSLHQSNAEDKDSSPPDPNQPCLAPNTATYMTAANPCSNDNFSVVFVSFNRGGYNLTAVAGPDTVYPNVKHLWVGPSYDMPNPNKVNVYIAVLRQSDGQFIIPKGVDQGDDNRLVDVKGTARKACFLFEQEADGKLSQPLTFAGVRMRLIGDGTRVLHNDFYNEGTVQPPEEGTPCEQYKEPSFKLPAYAGGGIKKARVGRMIDVYKPGGCQFAIDSADGCSKQ